MDSKNYQDHFFRKAKISGYRSRSAFKLIELDAKFKFLKNGIKLLDVGSSPGGWSQVISKNKKSDFHSRCRTRCIKTQNQIKA